MPSAIERKALEKAYDVTAASEAGRAAKTVPGWRWIWRELRMACPRCGADLLTQLNKKVLVRVNFCANYENGCTFGIKEPRGYVAAKYVCVHYWFKGYYGQPQTDRPPYAFSFVHQGTRERSDRPSAVAYAACGGARKVGPEPERCGPVNEADLAERRRSRSGGHAKLVLSGGDGVCPDEVDLRADARQNGQVL